MTTPATAGFTGITTDNGPQASAFSSLMQSLASVASGRSSSDDTSAAGTGTGTTTATETGSSSVADTSTEPAATSTATSASAGQSSASETAGAAGTASKTASLSPITSSTFATSTLSSGSATADSTATPIQSVASTSTSAASSTSATAVAAHSKCHSISCSAGLKAAVAVPVVVVVLLALGLLFFGLARRRRRGTGEQVRRPPIDVDEKAKSRKKWSRHLRVFSFGEELLMGGRYSSSNSMRTGDGESMASVGHTAVQTHQYGSGLQTVDEEVAPPYRDSISRADRPLATPRPSSAATAPPPYGFEASTGGSKDGATSGRTSRAIDHRSQQQSLLSSSSGEDPFHDEREPSPISPAEPSPFHHPDDNDADIHANAANANHQTTRRSSVLESIASDSAASDPGIVGEARVQRGVSMSGARAVTVKRNSTQQLSDSGASGSGS